MRKIIIAVSIALCFAAFSLCAAADAPAAENIGAAVIYNIENDKVLYSYNADGTDGQVYPVGTVKLMTALCAYEALSARLDERVTITDEMRKGVLGNNIGLASGETVTIENLFNALCVRGANDAAYALAYLTSGSIESFVELLNARAAELGMEHTVYTNPTGMHSAGMVTTAGDTMLLAREFCKNTFLRDMAATVKYVFPETDKADARTLFNRNALICKATETEYYNSQAKGMHASSTNEGGYAVITECEGDGLTYLILVMGGKEIDGINYAYVQANAYISWAKKSFAYVEVLRAGKIICEIPVTLSTEADYVTLVPSESLTLFLPTDIDIEKELTYTKKVNADFLPAPVLEGQEAGFITVSRGDEILGTIPLIAKNQVTRSEFLYVLHCIEMFVKSTFFLAALISVVILSVAYVIIKAIYLDKRRRRHRNFRR